MSSLDFDLDSQMSHLESVWRQAYEASLEARAELQALNDTTGAIRPTLEKASQRLDKAEQIKERVMAKIERLEEKILNRN